MTTENWKIRALAAEKTAEMLKQKVVSLYQGESKTIVHKQLERSRQRDAENQRRRELLEVRQEEMRRYTAELEEQVEARTRAIRTILDNVTFGFFLVDRHLALRPGFTASCSALFGREVEVGDSVPVLLDADERTAFTLETLVDQVFDDILPEEVALDQLPRRFAVQQRVLALDAKVVRGQHGEVDSLLVSVSDISDLESARREAHRNGALIAILGRKSAFVRFVVDARGALEEARVTHDVLVLRRLLHTVKGNAASWGLVGVSELVHQIEEREVIAPEDVERIRAALAEFLADAEPILGIPYDVSPMPRSASCPASDLLGPVEVVVDRLAEKLGKEVALTVRGADTPVDPERVGQVFRNLTHVLRNAVDHGIEAPGERGEKPRRGQITVEVSCTADAFEIEVADDGRGIDTDRVGRKALSQGIVSSAELEAMSPRQRLELVLLDGLSSADEATEISGRGVGLASLRGVIDSCGGELEVHSELGRGTRFVVRVPKSAGLSSAA